MRLSRFGHVFFFFGERGMALGKVILININWCGSCGLWISGFEFVWCCGVGAWLIID